MLEYYVGNRGGIVMVQATQTNAGAASTTKAVYTLPNHTFKNIGLQGIIIVAVDKVSTGLPGVEIQVNNDVLPLNNSDGSAATGITAGTHILYFDKRNNLLEILV